MYIVFLFSSPLIWAVLVCIFYCSDQRFIHLAPMKDSVIVRMYKVSLKASKEPWVSLEKGRKKDFLTHSLIHTWFLFPLHPDFLLFSLLSVPSPILRKHAYPVGLLAPVIFRTNAPN